MEKETDDQIEIKILKQQIYGLKLDIGFLQDTIVNVLKNQNELIEYLASKKVVKEGINIDKISAQLQQEVLANPERSIREIVEDIKEDERKKAIRRNIND